LIIYSNCSIVMFFVFFLFIASASAEWPPEMCDKGVRFYNKKDVQLTGNHEREVENTCIFTSSFHSTFFMEFGKRYSTSRSKMPLDSTLTLRVQPEGKSSAFDIEIHNDRLHIVASPNETKPECLRYFASTAGTRFWMRVRVHNLVDLKKTFVSIAVSDTSQQQLRFDPCVRKEFDTEFDTFNLTIIGKSESGMEQWVYKMTNERPVEVHAKNMEGIVKRLAIAEERIHRLQDFISQTDESLTYRQKALTKETRTLLSRASSKATSHFTFHICLLIAVVILFCVYLRYGLSPSIKQVTHIL